MRLSRFKAYTKQNNLSGKTAHIFSSFFVGLTFTYLSLGGFSKLNPRNIDWIYGDNITAYIAQLFYIEDQWRFPLATNPNYGAELSTSLSFTGPPIPLAIFQKIFLIPSNLQLFGFWFALIFIFQAFFAISICRELQYSLTQSVGLSILFFTPFLLQRTQFHYWLSAHFLILWAILLIIRFFKYSKVSKLQSSVLLVFSYLINGYLFVMVLIILSYMWLHYIQNGSKSRKRAIIDLIWINLPMPVSLFIFEGINSQNNLYESIRMTFGGGYGSYPFNLISFINPFVGFTDFYTGGKNEDAITLNFSSFDYSFGATKGSYEGFMYLGLGVILMIVLTFLKSDIQSDRKIKVNKKITIIYFSLITLFSVTYRVSIGSNEVNLKFPYLGTWALSTFRASSRFMWIIAYIILILAIWKLHKKYKKLILNSLIVTILFTQGMDLYKPVIQRFASQEFSKSKMRLTNKEWDSNESFFRKFETIRTFPVGNGVTNWDKISFMSWKVKATSDSIQSSRPNFVRIKKMYEQNYSAICSGSIKPGVLYGVPKDYINLLSDCDLRKLKKRFINNEFFFWTEYER